MTLFFNIFFPFLLVFFTLISIKFLIQFLNKNQILDIPNERSNHKSPIPKGAGIIIIPLLSLSIIYYSHINLISKMPWAFLALLMTTVCLFSFYDDVKDLPSRKKLFFQFLFVLIGMVLFNKDLSNFILKNFQNENFFFDNTVMKIFFFILLSIFWLWVMNLFNFMDGIDGITAVQVIFFSIGLIVLSFYGVVENQFSYLGILIFSIFLGFLYWNISPSKIFIGDSGSIPIGFLVGSIIIWCFLNEKGVIPICITIFYYLSDSSVTLLNRIKEKRNIFIAHSEHFYQKKIRKGFSHRFVLKYVILINIMLLLFSILYLKIGIFAIISTLLTVVAFLFWLNKEQDKNL